MAQRHSLTALLSERCPEAEFVNDLGVKWWRLDWPGVFFLTEFPSGERKWVALNDGQVVYETDDIGALSLWADLRGHRPIDVH